MVDSYLFRLFLFRLFSRSRPRTLLEVADGECCTGRGCEASPGSPGDKANWKTESVREQRRT
eukprot:2484578-Pyramimonas_sp.AAC.2